MWRTPDGTRRLAGAERGLFVAAAVGLCEMLEEEPEWETGVEVIDRMEPEQRRIAVLRVARALLGGEPEPDLCAWNEGAVLAVFNHLHTLMELELDAAKGNARTSLRRLVHAAQLERCHDAAKGIGWEADEGPGQKPTSKNAEAWRLKVEGLADEILHDRDCEDDQVTDLHPQRGGAVKEYLGIAEGYYTSVPSLATPDELRALERLRSQLVKEANRATERPGGRTGRRKRTPRKGRG